LNPITEFEVACPMKVQGCPVVAQIRLLQEECRRLQELASRDGLTGLFNARHFFAALETEMERARRSGLATCLIMIDLDHFKNINDTYGHEAGNKCLQIVAKTLTDNIRRMDIACRYGGEEFAVILPGTALPEAVVTAERLRKALAGSRIGIGEGFVKLTASFGVSAYEGSEKLPAEQFVEHSDRFLLRAKARGRNRVCYDERKLAPPTGEVTEKERAALLQVS